MRSAETEIKDIEDRLADADKLALKADNNGWKNAQIAVKPLPELCTRAKGLADRLAAAAAKLPVLTKKFKDNGGSIPANLIICGNNDANGHYLSRCNETGRKPHPARFPATLPQFFIRFLTTEGDIVFDSFAGSNTTGAAAEALDRQWFGVEPDRAYIEGSRGRFAAVDDPD